MKFAYHAAWILFWIPKRQAVTTDNGFILKRKLKEIREKRKSHKPFQSYLLTGQADSAKKAG